MQLSLFDALDSPANRLPPAAEADHLVLAPSTLADVLAAYDDAVSDHPRRSNIRSCLKTVGQAIGRPLDQIPADPASLRPLLAQGLPALARVKPRTWVQAKSTTLGALRHLGVAVARSRDDTPLSEAWKALVVSLPGQRDHIGLSRLLRYFSRTGVQPADVDEAVFAAFRRELMEASLRHGAETSYRQAVRKWNAAVAGAPNWPQVKIPVPSDPRHYSLAWEAFPPSFVVEVESFLKQKRASDPLEDDYAPATRGATERGRRKSLRQLASALVASGAAPLEAVTGLTVLTEIENVRSALRHLRADRFDGKVAPSLINLAWLLRTIARHWLKDEARAEAIKTLIANLTVHAGGRSKAGITPKNRQRLEQFKIPDNVDRLISLPTRVLRCAAGSTEPRHLDSVRVMYALQVGILTSVPIRLKNLTALESGSNLIDIGKGSKRSVRIRLTARETKTYREYEAPLPSYLFPLLDAWMTVHRRRVCDQPSTLLFPNASGQLRSAESLSSKISRFIDQETGLKMNPHLFRHFAAKIYLDYDPSGIEIVRQLLGHSSIKTTLRVYAELQTDPAFQRYEDALKTSGKTLTSARKSARKS